MSPQNIRMLSWVWVEAAFVSVFVSWLYHSPIGMLLIWPFMGFAWQMSLVADGDSPPPSSELFGDTIFMCLFGGALEYGMMHVMPLPIVAFVTLCVLIGFATMLARFYAERTNHE